MQSAVVLFVSWTVSTLDLLISLQNLESNIYTIKKKVKINISNEAYSNRKQITHKLALPNFNTAKTIQ